MYQLGQNVIIHIDTLNLIIGHICASGPWMHVPYKTSLLLIIMIIIRRRRRRRRRRRTTTTTTTTIIVVVVVVISKIIIIHLFENKYGMTHSLCLQQDVSHCDCTCRPFEDLLESLRILRCCSMEHLRWSQL